MSENNLQSDRLKYMHVEKHSNLKIQKSTRILKARHQTWGKKQSMSQIFELMVVRVPLKSNKRLDLRKGQN